MEAFQRDGAMHTSVNRELDITLVYLFGLAVQLNIWQVLNVVKVVSELLACSREKLYNAGPTILDCMLC